MTIKMDPKSAESARYYAEDLSNLVGIVFPTEILEIIPPKEVYWHVTLKIYSRPSPIGSSCSVEIIVSMMRCVIEEKAREIINFVWPILVFEGDE